jgi:hypothetical protein
VISGRVLLLLQFLLIRSHGLNRTWIKLFKIQGREAVHTTLVATSEGIIGLVLLMLLMLLLLLLLLLPKEEVLQ